jgi:hypothetical protein
VASGTVLKHIAVGSDAQYLAHHLFVSADCEHHQLADGVGRWMRERSLTYCAATTSRNATWRRARFWMEHVKTGTVADTTPPPAPSRVRVSAKAGDGAEITWEAEADFESGIGGFAILRDGQALAKLPEKPPTIPGAP